MAFITWKQSWFDTIYPLKNGAVSVYLSGTTTSARVFDTNDVLHDTAPQLYVDVTGYTEFQFDDDDYPENQAFDLVCVPDPLFNPGVATKRVDAIQPYLSSGSIRDRSGNWDIDINSGVDTSDTKPHDVNRQYGRYRWNGEIRLEYFDTNNLAFYPETDETGAFEIGLAANIFDTIDLRSKTWTRLHSADGATLLSLEAGSLSSCHALTVIGCSPGLAMISDEDVEQAVTKVQKIKDDLGEIEIGDHGYHQLAVHTLPDAITNKHKLYEDLRKENCDLINWEDFCLFWDEGEFDKWRGGARGIDPFTLSIVLNQDKRIKALEEKVLTLQEKTKDA